MKHLIAGFTDFLRRYASVFRSVWAVREQLDPPKRTPEELAFLPAQLELVETPVSPLPRWSMRIIVALASSVLAWACIGKLDVVAVAGGRIIPSGRTKIIQPLEAAVVKAIHVRDGQSVKAGDLMIELDAGATSADLKQARDALAATQGNLARYRALLAAMESGTAPDAFRFDAPASEIATQNQLAQSEFTAYRAQRDSVRSQMQQREAELTTLRAMLPSLEEADRLASRRVADLERLQKQDFVAPHEVITAKQAQVEAGRIHTQQLNRVTELQAGIAAQREELDGLSAEFERKLRDGQRSELERLAQLEQEVGKTTRRDELMRITAPVDGTVQQLAVHTIGGVVTPAQALMALVPADDTLEVEAMVLNKDIGFIKPGQTAVIKVESFPFTRYGAIDGEVISISHDAQQNEQLGLVFQARVRMARSSIDVEGAEIRLTPGMSLSVEIKTGTRRVIDYLLSPLKRQTGEAMRER